MVVVTIVMSPSVLIASAGVTAPSRQQRLLPPSLQWSGFHCRNFLCFSCFCLLTYGTLPPQLACSRGGNGGGHIWQQDTVYVNQIRSNGTFYRTGVDAPRDHVLDYEYDFWMYTTNSSKWTGDWSGAYNGYLSYDMITRHANDPSTWSNSAGDPASPYGTYFPPGQGPLAPIHRPTSEIRITGSALDEM